MTKVSVILVNFRGSDDTIAAVEHLRACDWPKEDLEIVIVENGSGDGSLERLQQAVGNEVIVDAGKNLGFAAGCNTGVAHSSGDIVAFLNNDARPDRQWIKEAVKALESDPSIGCVASKVLDWSGHKIDYVDGALTWFGMSYKQQVEQEDQGQWNTPKNVLFPTGAAMFVPRAIFDELGGFDERFFMFYEDVDFGWRVTLAGYDVRYVPTSVAFHRHHVSMNKHGKFRENYLLERNALACLYKNLDDEHLQAVFAATLLLTNERSAARVEKHSTMDAYDGGTISKDAATGPYAIAWFTKHMDYFRAQRESIQGARKRTDAEILRLMRNAYEPLFSFPKYLDLYENLTKHFGLFDTFSNQSKVLIITDDSISEKMAGPAIRAWEMATRLSVTHDVRLFSTAGTAKAQSPLFEVLSGSEAVFHGLTDWADFIIFQGFALEKAPWLMESSKVIVADIYDPMHLEQLEQAKDLGPQGRKETIQAVTDVLNRQIARADLFLCASEKQRAFWMGQLAAMGRLNANLLDGVEDPRSLIEIVPFGLNEERPTQDYHAIKGKVPGISLDDKVILWGGGVYNWFDPLTLIRAVDRLAKKHNNVRLYFLGVKHPNPGVPKMRMTQEAMDLSDSLGLTGKHVFFNHDWVDYNDRHNYLLDADCGVSTHFEHIETQYSFRTRILDYLWAGLPIVATNGDSFGNVLDSEKIGVSVSPEDVNELSDALEKVLFDDDFARVCRENVARYSVRFEWNNALAPLLRFAQNPRRAADMKYMTAGHLPQSFLGFVKVKFNLLRDVKLVASHLKAGGPKLLIHKVQSRLRKMLP